MSTPKVDRKNLDAALAIIRKHCPKAVAVNLETSDQNKYGFVVRSIEYSGPEYGEVPEQIEDEIFDLLCDLDWDSEVGESPQGYARIALR